MLTERNRNKSEASGTKKKEFDLKEEEVKETMKVADVYYDQLKKNHKDINLVQIRIGVNNSTQEVTILSVVANASKDVLQKAKIIARVIEDVYWDIYKRNILI